MRDQGLAGIFVRDLDRIPLPDPSVWIPSATRRSSRTWSRPMLTPAIVAIVLALAIAAAQIPAVQRVLEQLLRGEVVPPAPLSYTVASRSLILLTSGTELSAPTEAAVLAAGHARVERLLRERGSAVTLPEVSYAGDRDAAFARFKTTLERARASGIDPGELERAAIVGFMTATGDCGSYFDTAEDRTAYDRLSPDRGRVKAAIQQIRPHTESPPEVFHLIPGGLSERAGLRIGDRILSIDGESLAGATGMRTALLLAGAPGSRAEVQVLRDGARLTFTVEREAGVTPRARPTLVANGIAYLDVRRLEDLRDVRAVIQELADLAELGVTGLAIDMRSGHDEDAAVQALVGSLLPGEPIATVVQADGRTRVLRAALGERRITQRDVVVLIDRRTADAYLAAAAMLRERGVARLIGEPTDSCAGTFTDNKHASGTVWIRDGRYVSPVRRRDLFAAGIDPDELVRAIPGRDAPLDAAIAWLRERSR